MVAIANVIVAAVTVVAFSLTAIALLAWNRARDAHMLFLAAAFAVFFGKGLLLTIILFVGWGDLGEFVVLSGILDLVILALFYGFTLRR